MSIGHQRFQNDTNGMGIDANLNRAAPIVSTCTEEISTMKQKRLNADFVPLAYVIRQINEKCYYNTQDDYIIKQDFFDVPKLLVLAEIHCIVKENFF